MKSFGHDNHLKRDIVTTIYASIYISRKQADDRVKQSCKFKAAVQLKIEIQSLITPMLSESQSR